MNFVHRLSGIATMTAAFAARLGGLSTRLVVTRKTTPGLRVLEKYAVRVGGGHNHRFNLADAVLLLRYFEASGEVRQAISVMKKRGGEHERTIREFRLANGTIEVGEPLRKFRGVLTGVPQYEAGDAPGFR